MAILTQEAQDYLKGGGTLVNNQIPTQSAPTGTNYNSPVLVPTTLNSANTQSAPPVNVPSQDPTTNAPGLNTSVGTPISSAESIINESTVKTPEQIKQQAILDKYAELVGSNKTQTTLTNEAEKNAGLSAQASTINDLYTQQEGLNNQDTALQNEALKGGSIENIANNNAIGVTGMTGVNANITKALRDNQIKRAAIASSSLTVKSALFGALGKYNLAKDAADKAATAQYEQQQQAIDAQKAQLEALAPTLNKQEKAQAAIQAAKLADRQAQLDQAKEAKKTILAMATSAITNFPNDPAAQYAANQALTESNKQNPDLSKIISLIGQYQKDPVAAKMALLDIKLKQSSIDKNNVEIAKTKAEIAALNPIPVTGTNKKYVDAFNSAATGLTAAQQKQTTATFNQLLSSGDTEGAKSYIVRVALSGAPVDQQNQAIGRTQALSALQDIQSLLKQAKDKGVDTNILSGGITNVAQKLGTTNDKDLSYIASRIQQQIQIYRRSMTGVAFSPQESAEYAKIFPDITNTDKLNTTKIQALVDAFDSNNRSQLSFFIGDTNYKNLFGEKEAAQLPSNSGTVVMTGPGGTYNVPKNQVELFKQNGYK